MKKLSAVLAVILVTMLAAVPVLAGDMWITVPYTDASVTYDGFWRTVNNPNAFAGRTNGQCT